MPGQRRECCTRLREKGQGKLAFATQNEPYPRNKIPKQNQVLGFDRPGGEHELKRKFDKLGRSLQLR